jgi:selenocysteine lyase/cysteine desulfurase
MTLDLREHFSEFRGAALASEASGQRGNSSARARPGRIHLAAHSHHFWPDAACEAHRRALADAARLADNKWEVIFGEVVPRAQRGIASILALPDPATIAFAPNTHDFVRRLLSALPAGAALATPDLIRGSGQRGKSIVRALRILTSDGEFHSFARQIARLEEDGLVAVERIPTEPFASFSERFASAARRGGHDLVFVSQVFFNSAATSGALGDIVNAVPDPKTLVAVDGYHGFMALPTDIAAVADRAFYMAGGYKYAMAGEGVCFMHCPPGFAMRPRDTGWFAAFGALSGSGGDTVAYGTDGTRFMGATFDPSGLYRLAAVFDWMDGIGLTVAAIHAHVLELQDLFRAEIARAGVRPMCEARLVTPVASGTARGHFLTYETPSAQTIHDRLARADIITDVRGERIRFGFGCYHTAEEIEAAAAAIARALV